MSLFLILLCLMSVSIGHLAAVASWRRRLWVSVRRNDIPERLKECLSLPFQRGACCIILSLSILVLAHAFLTFGSAAALEVALALALASAIAKAFLQRRIHCMLHLKIVLQGLARRRQSLVEEGDAEAARQVDVLVEGLTKELEAMKLVRCATQVPTYDGSTLYLSIPGAKADNYYRSQRSGEES